MTGRPSRWYCLASLRNGHRCSKAVVPKASLHVLDVMHPSEVLESLLMSWIRCVWLGRHLIKHAWLMGATGLKDHSSRSSFKFAGLKARWRKSQSSIGRDPSFLCFGGGGGLTVDEDGKEGEGSLWLEAWGLILTWQGRHHDQKGGSPRARRGHCTPVVLTSANSPNVGISTA